MTDRRVARTVHALALLLAASGAAVVGEKAPWLAGWKLEESLFSIDKRFADPTVERLVLVFWATFFQPCRVGTAAGFGGDRGFQY